MERARLHPLVPPEDRVGPDAPLAVVDDGALVVGPQQHHRTVELEQVLVGEAVDLAVRLSFPVPDHPPHVPFGGNHLGHAGIIPARAP